MLDKTFILMLLHNRLYYFANRSVKLSSYIFPTGFVWNILCWQLYDQVMMTPPSMTDVSIHNDCKVPTIILRNNQQTLSTTIAFIQSLKSDTENLDIYDKLLWRFLWLKLQIMIICAYFNDLFGLCTDAQSFTPI